METSTTAADPSTASKPMRFVSYANGGLKRHYPTTPAATSPPVSYKECMRNYAASMGGHALDGCCEFMPDHPTSLRCAACGCHRNFHRRDPDDPAPLHRHIPASLKTPSPAANGKKRHRTKFSDAQKEKMREFSERLGWKLQKIDRRVVDDFCNEIRVGREVLKVWMHNHKTTTNAHPPRTAGDGPSAHAPAQFHHHHDLVVSSADASSSSSSSGFSL